MKTLTDEKLTIVGAAGMIGSNMAQTAIMMGLTSNICLYDPYAPGLEGVAEELFHCGFEGVNITFTSDIKEALTGAKYIVNSGGAARKAGMTREDLAVTAIMGDDVRWVGNEKGIGRETEWSATALPPGIYSRSEELRKGLGIYGKTKKDLCGLVLRGG